jgi:hypothetical protein
MLRAVTTGPSSEDEPQVLELCRLMMNGTYNECAKVLAGLKSGEPEKIRHCIMGYFSSVGLNGNAKAYKAMKAFRVNTYDNGFPQLTLSLMEYFGYGD